ncbi:uncharacterized protein LOC122245523 [Penaeus japonicus]|uniref:uncharacterized protein LOC122245523 n=1 Tax=Penaeus japonicus TaxID=27405 RepID=UPI001C71433C|nr:uncharacterized protein LOC122245523 [Penaeus japonicus]
MFLTRLIRGRTHPAGFHINVLGKPQRIPKESNKIRSSSTLCTTFAASRTFHQVSNARRGNELFSGHAFHPCNDAVRCHFGTASPLGEDHHDSSFNFFVLTTQDFEEVKAFLGLYFFPKEPLTLGARCEDEVDMDDLIMKCVASGVSVGFRDKATRELVGVRLSSILSSKPKTQPPPESVPPEVAKVINMLNHLWEAVDVFADPGVKRVMKSDILTVHTGYNGRGLAKAMVERSERLAEGRGCHLLYTQPTNAISAKIFAQRGYDTRYTIDLDTVLDKQGNRVFDTSVMFGNNVIRVMSKRVDSGQ